MSFCVLGKRRDRDADCHGRFAPSQGQVFQGVRCKARRVVREADPYTPFTDRIS